MAGIRSSKAAAARHARSEQKSRGEGKEKTSLSRAALSGTFFFIIVVVFLLLRGTAGAKEEIMERTGREGEGEAVRKRE